jgi:hypothetical protein
MSHSGQDTQRECLMGSTGCWTKTSTADATRQHTSENKPFSPSAEESEGRTARNLSLGLISSLGWQVPGKQYGRDSVRPRQ